MNRIKLFAFLISLGSVFATSCDKYLENDLGEDDQRIFDYESNVTRSFDEDSVPLLIFKTQDAFHQVIGNSSNAISMSSQAQTQDGSPNFGYDDSDFQYLPNGGLMNNHPLLVENGKPITYYEALGYDTLVPNVNFARVLNIKGEVCVDSTVVRITPAGTFSFPLSDKRECEDFINNYDVNSIPDIPGQYTLNSKVTLTRTYSDASLEGTGWSTTSNNEEIDTIQYEINGEPNFDSFSEFVAGSKTWFGKLIESIIGSNSAHSVYYADSNYRLRGKFYFYDYFIYAETGVTGWTDKKHGLFWKKEICDELRIGWRRIRIRYKVDKYFEGSIMAIPSPIYVPPQEVIIEGRKVNMAVLVLPEYSLDMKEKLTQHGIQALFNIIRSKYGVNLPYSFSDAQGCIVATPKYIYCELDNQDIVKFSTKKLNYVFFNSWLSFNIGWSNRCGFFFNNINQNNYNQVLPWISMVFKNVNGNPATLLSGEVYVCGRFGTSWRGMKIRKRNEIEL